MKCPAPSAHLVALFAALAMSGAHAQAGPPPTPSRAQLSEELGVGAEQATRLEEVLRRDRLRHDAAREQTRQEIAALKLNREQQARLDRQLAPPPRREPGERPPPERDCRPSK